MDVSENISFNSEHLKSLIIIFEFAHKIRELADINEFSPLNKADQIYSHIDYAIREVPVHLTK
ncbi:hypothetical protein D0466_16005 [Peribacillus glennii]|uniref:Uncharacterized protein n=1 Tax=Peribacillus glennii TaxID=2303991 RepID=A0A372L995_9BACI|nr:hypothetical protein D0466_16005 [Peribacillus glennii]